MSGLKRQIEALKAKLSRKGKQLPSVCFVHYQVLGIMRRDGPPMFAIPDFPVTHTGSRPPTESLASIDQSRFLQHVPRAKRALSIYHLLRWEYGLPVCSKEARCQISSCVPSDQAVDTDRSCETWRPSQALACRDASTG